MQDSEGGLSKHAGGALKFSSRMSGMHASCMQ